jgi:hypothetical protein
LPRDLTEGTKRAMLVDARARELLAAIDRNLEHGEWPFKYVVPWREARLLWEALES